MAARAANLRFIAERREAVVSGLSKKMLDYKGITAQEFTVGTLESESVLRSP
jgi:hypothetical protein